VISLERIGVGISLMVTFAVQAFKSMGIQFIRFVALGTS